MEKPDFMKYGVTRLPPGFRFHPTDEELVVQYLRRKAFSWPLPAAVIPEIDLGKYDPWDLPGGGKEGEQYFFSLREAKYLTGKRHNRATISGYWKATGKNTPVIASRCNQLVGLKKVLVFYRGKPPHGSRTDWIMHEYCLAAPETTTFSFPQRKISAHSSMVPSKHWVVCRIFKKRRASRIDAETTPYYNYSRIRNNNVELIDPGPSLSSSSSSSSCVTNLSVDGEEGCSSNDSASSPNGREM
ncbi:NAC domain-containing protein 83-like [Phoenix dactylifera]|uniref:NAC domain-containing protein 83-like n=1 Tax=Phoenix dactylifera TaxID=42345 RepID=A0A8B7D4U1_PHODC|nr:NAC domain-containing protein 83-like [Phoenix dactylifera]